jgi:hypothetical protein
LFGLDRLMRIGRGGARGWARLPQKIEGEQERLRDEQKAEWLAANE